MPKNRGGREVRKPKQPKKPKVPTTTTTVPLALRIDGATKKSK